MRLQEVHESAMALPFRSRLKLVKQLAKSIEPERTKLTPVEAEIIAEAEARIDAYERGELKTISLKQFFNHIDRPAHAPHSRQSNKARV